jgi:hypothetical protein
VPIGALSLVGEPLPTLRLVAHAVTVPALTSAIRPALVIGENETGQLLAAAAEHSVRTGGCYSAGPAGIQVWTGPFDAPDGGPGTAVLLGSLDWNLDTPARHYATAHRAMVTAIGLDRGETTASILGKVLALTGLQVDSSRVGDAMPPPRDPFRPR